MRTRIVVLAVCASVLAIGLFGVPLAVAVLQYALQVERNQLRGVADAMAIVVAGDVYDEEPIGDLGRYGSIDVAVYDADGVLLGGRSPAGSRTQVVQALAGRVETGTQDDHLVVAVPVTHDGDVIGAVQAAAPRGAVVRAVALVWAAMAALAALAVAATWLVGRWQARRLARPLEELVGAARRLGDGDFSVRTSPGGVPEIDAVGSALNGTAQRLDELLARERAFSADASHQLRTPLAGLRLRLEAALEQPDGDLRAAIGESVVDADRLEATIEELLTLSRAERVDRSQPLDLAALLEELCAEWSGRLALQDRDLVVTVDHGVAAPRAPAATVRQVLAVLVDNATVHGRGTVALTVREAADAVAVDVADEGPGVRDPESVLFARRPETGDGHGIGLALARRLAEAEHGRLKLTRPSPPVFTLLLPPASGWAATPGVTAATGDGHHGGVCGGPESPSSSRYP